MDILHNIITNTALYMSAEQIMTRLKIIDTQDTKM